ncbi:MAG: Holliday junction resolvase RuvX [Chloroflexi bacterium]|nr:Holliday junction resolvase RuvX [Chloroflexota bacterium]
MRCLGLDVGDRRIGVAMSDPEGILASPFSIIDRTDEAADVEAISSIVRQREVGKVIVGLPRSMDGSLGHQAEKVQAFVRKLAERINVPLEFRDERLTTVSARRMMRESGARRDKEKARDDAAAAAVILQGYLDEKREYPGDLV